MRELYNVCYLFQGAKHIFLGGIKGIKEARRICDEVKRDYSTAFIEVI